jgi:imidazolonepropionase-like amidohydrolase
MSVLRVRGRALPSGEPVDLYADGDRWTTDPVPGAELVAEGWLLPGLVDAHTHPGAEEIGDPLDPDVLRADLRRHAESGVALIRAPGLVADPPDWFGNDPTLPRAVHAGPWFAQEGQFFKEWGRRPAPADLPALAAAQAAATGWAKLIGDWHPEDRAVPEPLLRAVVEAVHAAGGRVAMHAMTPAGCVTAVAAGVDSLEHGMCLDTALLDQMAAQGTALTPTLALTTQSLVRRRGEPDTPRNRWYVGGASAHPAVVAAAVEAGVTVLAGTDSRPHGTVAEEVRAIAAAGVPPPDALAAASWQARAYLGLPGLEPGAPADAVIYAEDPRGDLRRLDTPRAVILRGRRVR